MTTFQRSKPLKQDGGKMDGYVIPTDSSEIPCVLAVGRRTAHPFYPSNYVDNGKFRKASKLQRDKMISGFSLGDYIEFSIDDEHGIIIDWAKANAPELKFRYEEGNVVVSLTSIV